MINEQTLMAHAVTTGNLGLVAIVNALAEAGKVMDDIPWTDGNDPGLYPSFPLFTHEEVMELARMWFE